VVPSIANDIFRLMGKSRKKATVLIL
jgi:hypothetical protein